MVLSLNNKKSHKIILQNIDFMTFFGSIISVVGKSLSDIIGLF